MKTRILTCFLLLVGCGREPDSKNAPLGEPTSDVEAQILRPSKFCGNTIFLIHGLTEDEKQFLKGPTLKLTTHLLEEGWRVVLISLPHTIDPKGMYQDLKKLLSTNYGAWWKSQLEWVISSLPQTNSKNSKFIVGGISWGGLHALMAQSYFSQFNGYFALIPTVDIGSLKGFHGFENPEFNPMNEIQNLKLASGFFAFGNKDEAVPGQLTHDLAWKLRSLKAPIQVFEYAEMGHDILPEMIFNLNHWIDNL